MEVYGCKDCEKKVDILQKRGLSKAEIKKILDNQLELGGQNNDKKFPQISGDTKASYLP